MVAKQTPGEPVHGALRELIERLSRIIAIRGITLTNGNLEATPLLHPLIDGIDPTLIDLAAEEVGEEALVAAALRLADQTFASQQTDPASRKFLHTVFELRARRVVATRTSGRLAWVRETGARLRMLATVEAGLFPRRTTWNDIAEPLDPGLVDTMLEWAWGQADLQAAVREAYRLENDADTESVKQSFLLVVGAWLRGQRFQVIGSVSMLAVDDLLGMHARVVSYVLQTLVEQGVVLLAKLVAERGGDLSPAVVLFPDHLRFGVPTAPGRVLAAAGIRHRSAAVELGNALVATTVAGSDRLTVCIYARNSLLAHPTAWEARLGKLVYANALSDLSSAIGDEAHETHETET